MRESSQCFVPEPLRALIFYIFSDSLGVTRSVCASMTVIPLNLPNLVLRNLVEVRIRGSLRVRSRL